MPSHHRFFGLDREIAQIEFNKTIAGCYRDGNAEYESVGVLLLTWRDDDMQCKEKEVLLPHNQKAYCVADHKRRSTPWNKSSETSSISKPSSMRYRLPIQTHRCSTDCKHSTAATTVLRNLASYIMVAMQKEQKPKTGWIWNFSQEERNMM